jgi:hypothetical protein
MAYCYNFLMHLKTHLFPWHMACTLNNLLLGLISFLTNPTCSGGAEEEV